MEQFTGLPVYEDGRGFEVSFEDKKTFSLSELPEGRRITVTDDKGCSFEFRTGPLSTIDVKAPDGSSNNVPFLVIRELRGDDIRGVEQIQTGLYSKDESLDVELFPPREPGQASPAIKQGLRLVVNPWNVFRIAPSKIQVHEITSIIEEGNLIR